MKTPKAPDPYETANAQGGMNRDTAISQQLLNMNNQVNPWGSVSYQQTGETGYRDSQGNWISVPRFTQTTKYTPQQQAIFDASQKAQGNLANIAVQQSAKIGDLLNNPFEFTNSDAEQWAYDLASPRILAQQGQNEDALRNRLINQGIRPGTNAWDTEMTRLTNANSDQLNQLALTGRGQAFSEALQKRNQPLNEIIGLMSGTQLQNPGQQSPAAPQTGVAGVDYTGLVNQKYQSELASSQAAMGGLFGLGGSLISALPSSDRRLKRDITRIGTTNGGNAFYRFRYKDSDVWHVGVMAQEVPDAAVMDESGFLRVDYARVS